MRQEEKQVTFRLSDNDYGRLLMLASKSGVTSVTATAKSIVIAVLYDDAAAHGETDSAFDAEAQ